MSKVFWANHHSSRQGQWPKLLKQKMRRYIYQAGECSGHPAVEIDATEPVGDPMEELARELVPVPMPWRLSTPLRLMA